MSFLDELAARYVAQGVGVLGTSILLSNKAVVPDTDSAVLTITETGGTSPERSQNAVTTPAYQRPRAQILARAKSYQAARALAKAAYDASFVRNTALSGTFYRELDPVQEPFDMGLDANQRARVAFNVAAIKRPS